MIRDSSLERLEEHACFSRTTVSWQTRVIRNSQSFLFSISILFLQRLSFLLASLALAAWGPGSQRVIVAQHEAAVVTAVGRRHAHRAHTLVRAHAHAVHRHRVHRVHALHRVREHRRRAHRAQPTHGRGYSTHLHRRGRVRQRLLQLRRGRRADQIVLQQEK